MNDATVKCWGYNFSGQLGQGDIKERGRSPNTMGDFLLTVPLGTGKTATAISVGWDYACAILNDGSVKCWGGNYWGQLGLADKNNRGDNPGEMGDNLPSVDLGTGMTAVAIAAGQTHVCVILNDASIKCWGNNSYGQLGVTWPIAAVNLGTGKTAVALTTPGNSTCALLNDGTVKCWGYNAYGQLGLGDTISRGGSASSQGDNLPVVNIF